MDGLDSILKAVGTGAHLLLEPIALATSRHSGASHFGPKRSRDEEEAARKAAADDDADDLWLMQQLCRKQRRRRQHHQQQHQDTTDSSAQLLEHLDQCDDAQFVAIAAMSRCTFLALHEQLNVSVEDQATPSHDEDDDATTAAAAAAALACSLLFGLAAMTTAPQKLSERFGVDAEQARPALDRLCVGIETQWQQMVRPLSVAELNAADAKPPGMSGIVQRVQLTGSYAAVCTVWTAGNSEDGRYLGVWTLEGAEQMPGTNSQIQKFVDSDLRRLLQRPQQQQEQPFVIGSRSFPLRAHLMVPFASRVNKTPAFTEPQQRFNRVLRQQISTFTAGPLRRLRRRFAAVFGADDWPYGQELRLRCARVAVALENFVADRRRIEEEECEQTDDGVKPVDAAADVDGADEDDENEDDKEDVDADGRIRRDALVQLMGDK